MATFITFPEYIAQEVVRALFAKSVLVNLVSKDWSPVIASQGESVTILSPDAVTVEEGSAAFASADATPTGVKVDMDQWKRIKPVKLGDKVDSMSAVDLRSIYVEPFAEGLIGQIETDLITAAMTLVPTVGTEGTPPTTFAALASNLKEKFDSLLIPGDNRYVVLGGAAENAFNQLFGIYTNAGAAAEQLMAQGFMTNKLGMNYFGSTKIAATDGGVAFHKSAIALVTRPLKVPPQAVPGTVAVASFNGVGIRVRSWYEPKDTATYLTADVLYGIKKLNERGFKILN